MISVKSVRGIAVCAVLLLAVAASGATFTSQQSGDWSDINTWGGSLPVFSDDVVITSSHVVTVSDARVARTLTLDSTNGNKMLVVQSTGTLGLDIAGSAALVINAPLPGSTSIVRIDGGLLDAFNSDASITGGSTAAKIEFTSLGGTARFARDVLFAGTMANAQIDFGGNAGVLEIGRHLGSGGSLVNTANSTVEINGTGTQTINAYTFHHFVVNKAGGTATLNGPIQINGDFTLTAGVLDDGGNQISLNGGGTSATTVGALGVLKLGSAGNATSFPTPHGTVTLASGSAVVYQAGATQTIQSDFAYDRLYLSTMGPTVDKILSDGSLQVNGELNIAKNGVNNVTLLLGTGTLDANADITGDGTVSVSSGAVNIAGNWGSSSVLSAGTSTITYDGSGLQQVLGATYHHLSINKSAGAAQFGGNATINGNLSVVSFGTLAALTNTITLLGDATVNSFFDVSNGTIRFNGTSAQSFTQSFSSFTALNFELNNANGLAFTTLGATISGLLKLNGGKLDVSGGSTFFVDVAATVNYSSGWIVGTLTMGMNPTPMRTFHIGTAVGSSRVDLQACKLEYSIVSPK